MPRIGPSRLNLVMIHHKVRRRLPFACAAGAQQQRARDHEQEPHHINNGVRVGRVRTDLGALLDTSDPPRIARLRRS